LHIDDQLNAEMTDLQVSGQGVLGAFAVGVLRPKLAKLEGKKLPLMAFSLGNVRLRDVAVAAREGLEVTAAFGSFG
jgi:hypothetical protein